MNPKKLKSSRGETLLEVLVALTIITLVGASFFSVLNRTILNNEKNGRDIQIMAIAQTEIESLTKSIKEGDSLITRNLKESIENHEYNLIDRQFDITSVGKITYYVEDDDEILYKCNLDIKDIQPKRGGEKTAYLYEVEIEVSVEDRKFTKRDIKIQTKVLSEYI